MFSFERINLILDTIEQNLAGDISYQQLAKMTAMSVYELRRIFAFIIGTPLSDYIRLRRLSQAVFDLREGELTITEIASKYRYESPSAFARAFREMQGISPTDAKNPDALLRNYPRASLTVSVSGMTDISFRLIRRGEMKLCGYMGITHTGDCCCEDVWEAFYEGGCHDRLLAENRYRDTLGGDLGQYAAYINSAETVGCTIGAILPENAAVPEGMDVYTIPPALWAVFEFIGATADQINNAYYKTLADWLASSVYERDPAVCNLEAFPADAPDDSGKIRWQIWYPLRKCDHRLR